MSISQILRWLVLLELESEYEYLYLQTKRYTNKAVPNLLQQEPNELRKLFLCLSLKLKSVRERHVFATLLVCIAASGLSTFIDHLIVPTLLAYCSSRSSTNRSSVSTLF